MWRKFMIILLWLIAGSIVVIGTAALLVQTVWWKNTVKTHITQFCERAGFELAIGSLEGTLPFDWKLRDVQLCTSEKLCIRSPEMRVRISLFPILTMHLVQAEQLVITLPTSSTTTASHAATFTTFLSSCAHLPIGLHIDHIHIDDILVLAGNTSPLFRSACRGKVAVTHGTQNVDIQLQLYDNAANFYSHLKLLGGASQNALSLSVDCHISSLYSLLPSLPAFIDGALAFEMNIAGPWETWRSFTHPMIAIPSTPLNGQLLGTFVPASHTEGSNKSESITLHEICATWGLTPEMLVNSTHQEPWSLQIAFEVTGDQHLVVAHSQATSSNARWEATGVLEEFFRPASGKITGSTRIESSALDPPGTLLFELVLDKEQAHAQFDAENVTWRCLHLTSLQATIDAAIYDGVWQGTAECHLHEQAFDVVGTSTFHAAPECHCVRFDDIELTGPRCTLGGYLHLDPTAVQGQLHLHASDLTMWQPLYTQGHLSGSIGAKVSLDTRRCSTVDVYAEELVVPNIQIGTLSICATLAPLHTDMQGSITLEIARVYLPDVYFSHVRLHTASEYGFWPFLFDIEGTWKEPFTAKATGYAQSLLHSSSLVLEQLDGTFLHQPVHLTQATFVEQMAGGWEVRDLSLRIGEGIFDGHIASSPTSLYVHAEAKAVPMVWLTLFTIPHLSLQGNASLACDIHATPEHLEGYCHIDVHHLEAQRSTHSPPLQARGTLQLHLGDTFAQIQGNIYATDAQGALFHVHIPLSYHLSPLRVVPDAERPLVGSLLLEGKIEDLFDFVATGTQRLQGWTHAHMLLAGHWNHPTLQGHMHISQGAYENYLIGLHVLDIEADAHADGTHIFLDRLHGTDGHQGTIFGTGEINIDLRHQLPFTLHLALEKLLAVDTDPVEMELSGNATLQGNLERATLGGTLAIDRANLTTPRSLPSEVLDPPILFLHKPLHLDNTPAHTRNYLFRTDLHLTASDTIAFDAHGLHSRWTGAVDLHGVGSHLMANGSLHLVRGKFTLMGKTFLLDQGELTCSDKPGAQGLLHLSGTLAMNDMTVMAQLHGPILSPQLSFQSIPPLPTSDILSLILFNKKLDEIKPTQALQLARTLMTLSGPTQWNVIDHIGSGLSTLGIDTFDIIPSEKGLNQTSIQIGKYFYLVRGVLVTLTQSLDSSQFRVEVDLGKGVLFQAENQSGEGQSQQEGKFSIQWNKNY